MYQICLLLVPISRTIISICQFCKRVGGVTLSAAVYIKEKFFITISITNNKNILKYCAFNYQLVFYFLLFLAHFTFN